MNERSPATRTRGRLLSRSPYTRWPQLLRHAVVGSVLVGVIFYIALYLTVAMLRLRYPFELEWIEGVSLLQVIRLTRGDLLYVAPTIRFVPLIYNPLFFYVAAALAKVIGGTFVALRLVSLLASLLTMAVLGLIVRRETGSWVAGSVSGGLFAATYKLSGAWLDIGRVDSLFICFLLIGVLCLWSRHHRATALVAGVAFGLSYLTKQTALVISAPLLLAMLLLEGRRALWCIAAFAVIGGGGVLLLNYLHDGWYVYYTLRLTGQQELAFDWPHAVAFWLHDLIQPLPVVVGGAALVIVRGVRQRRFATLVRYTGLGIGMIGGAWVATAFKGAYANDLIPAYALMAVVGGVALHEAQSALGSARHPLLCWSILGGAALLQWTLLLYDPSHTVPSTRDEAAGWQLVNEIRSTSGEVLVPTHEYLTVLSGKRAWASGQALSDVFTDPEMKLALIHDFQREAQAHRWAALYVDKPFLDFDRYYDASGAIFADDTLFWPVTGARSRPTTRYLPRH